MNGYKKSGRICSVHGCHNNVKKRKDLIDRECFVHRPLTRSRCPCGAPFDLHPPPKDEESLRLWLKALNLKKPPKQPFVCSFHFVDKRPTSEHPYPEKWLGYTAPVPKKRRSLVRTPLTLPVTEDEGCPVEEDDATNAGSQTWQADAQTQREEPTYPSDHHYTPAMLTQKPTCHKEVQCCFDKSLAQTILKNDASSRLYTGLPLCDYFKLVENLSPFYKGNFKLPVMDQILMTMMNLRLNLLQEDLAERFEVSQSVVSRIVHLWIDVMEEHMRLYIPWLPKETIQATMPQCFKKNYPGTTCIIDCSESILQQAKNLDSRGESYSHYYSSNTVKYLVAIAPSGPIMFISPAYGGRCSDKFITLDSGFLEYLHPGDEVMAVRGFTIRDLLHKRNVKLSMPAFTKKGTPLSEEDVTSTRQLTNVCIHVKRVIRRLQIFKILSQTVPINLVPKMDKILRICAALNNLQGEINHKDAN